MSGFRNRLLKSALTGGLPSGYYLCEYIESDGTQYIDTGFIPNQDTRVVTNVELKLDGNNYFLFGARYSEYKNTYGFNAYETCYRTHYNTTHPDYDTSVSYTTRFTIDKNKNITTIGGSNVIEQTYSAFEAPCSMYIFAVNENGTAKTFGTAKVFSFSIYDNGVLVRDYIPCINPDGYFGLYDKVGKTFYGSANNNPFTGKVYIGGSYTSVDYIDIVDNYINTGVKPNSNTRVILNAQSLITPVIADAYCWFGVRDATNKYFYELYDASSKYNSVYFFYGSKYTYQFDIDWSLKHKLEINKNTATIDGVSYTESAQSFSIDYELYIAADNNEGTMFGALSMRFYNCIIMEGDIVLRNYVPCVKADGTQGVFDLVNHTFYTLT